MWSRPRWQGETEELSSCSQINIRSYQPIWKALCTWQKEVTLPLYLLPLLELTNNHAKTDEMFKGQIHSLQIRVVKWRNIVFDFVLVIGNMPSITVHFMHFMTTYSFKRYWFQSIDVMFCKRFDASRCANCRNIHPTHNMDKKWTICGVIWISSYVR